MNEAYRLLYLLTLNAVSRTPAELLEMDSLRELMRLRSRAAAAYHLTPRGLAMKASKNANDPR